MAFFEFPHTRTYDSDLGWLISAYSQLTENVDSINEWETLHKEEYAALYAMVETITKNLTESITEWDPVNAYSIYSMVQHEGNYYIAIKDVPAGIMLDNTAYWTPANTIQQQINLLLNKTQLIYTPVMYGAKGDRVTDDTGAFMDMLQDVPANVSIDLGEKEYYINTFTACNRPGAALIKKALSITKPCKISNGTIFTSVPTDSYLYLVFALESSNITFENVRFINDANCRAIPVALDFEWDEDLPTATAFTDYTIKNCYFEYPFIAVSFNINDDEIVNTLSIENILFDGNRLKLSTATPSGGLDVHSIGTAGRIKNIIYTNNISYGGNNFSSYNAVSCADIIMDGNIASHNSFAGIEIENDCTNVCISDCILHNNNRGIWIDDNPATIIGAELHDNTTDIYASIGNSVDIDYLRISNSNFDAIAFGYVGSSTGNVKELSIDGCKISSLNFTHAEANYLHNNIIDSLSIYRNIGAYFAVGNVIKAVTTVSGSNPSMFTSNYLPNDLALPGSGDLNFTPGIPFARNNSGIRIVQGSGAPTNYYAPGSLYVRTDLGRLYVQTGSSTWSLVTTS